MEEGDELGKRPLPEFAFSHDDRYVARMGQNLISIYKLPSLKLLDKRSVSAKVQKRCHELPQRAATSSSC